MTDLRHRLSELDRLDPPDMRPGIDQRISGFHSAPPEMLVHTSGAGWRGPLIAIGTAVAILVVVAGSLLLLGGGQSDVVEEPTPTVTIETPTSIPDVSASGLPTTGFINEVSDLALASDGTVWAATRGGVVRWDKGASSPMVYGEGDGLPAADVNQIVVAADGTVWAAGDRWVAFYDETWQVVGAVNPWLSTLVADPTGGVWTTETSREDGEVLLHINRNGMEQISLPSMMGLSGNVWIAVDAAGRVYAVDGFHAVEQVEGHAVYVYEDDTWREFTTLAWPPGGTYSGIVTNIAIASDGTLWISTTPDSDPEPEASPGHGVASFDGQEWTTYTTADGLASDAGAVLTAPDGTVWVVHSGAVSRFDGDTWTAYDVEASPRSGAIGGSDGTLWLGTSNGISQFDGETTTPYVVPVEMTPATGLFSLDPAAPAALPVDAGSFGDIAWQKFNLPAGHNLMGGIATPHGFAATGSTSIRTSIDGVNWVTSEPPSDARHLVSSGDDLYALGAGATRLAWTGVTWKVVDDLNIPDPGPAILAEGGYVDFAERMAFGDGVTVMTARSRVFYSTDGHTFVPALQGPDPELLEGANELDSPDAGYAGGCYSSWSGGWPGEGSIGPVFATDSRFLAFTSGHPNDWNNFSLCRPVIWTSNDGSTWVLTSSESPFGSGAYVHDIAEHNGRFVAVGQSGLWESSDGLTWNETPPERISGSLTSVPWAIAAGEAGWVALFGDAGTHNGVWAMYSLDGLNWVVAAEAIPDLWWAWGTPDVAVGTDQILITYYTDVAYIGQITR